MYFTQVMLIKNLQYLLTSLQLLKVYPGHRNILHLELQSTHKV